MPFDRNRMRFAFGPETGFFGKDAKDNGTGNDSERMGVAI